MKVMAAPKTVAARRAWQSAERLAIRFQTPEQPSFADVFRRGFMNASMLQMAVCSPSRQSETRRYSAIFVNRMGATTAVGNAAAPAVEHENAPIA